MRSFSTIAVVFFTVILFGVEASGQTLIVGDSHSCGQFGKTLGAKLHADVQCVIGTAPNYWVPRMASILKAKTYSRVVFALGTNSLLEAKVDASYRALAATAGPRKCVWVGPPNLRPDQAKGFPVSRLAVMEANLPSFYTSLKISIGSCALIDSRPITAKSAAAGETVDGVHRGAAAGAAWANALAIVP